MIILAKFRPEVSFTCLTFLRQAVGKPGHLCICINALVFFSGTSLSSTRLTATSSSQNHCAHTSCRDVAVTSSSCNVAMTWLWRHVAVAKWWSYCDIALKLLWRHIAVALRWHCVAVTSRSCGVAITLEWRLTLRLVAVTSRSFGVSVTLWWLRWRGCDVT